MSKVGGQHGYNVRIREWDDSLLIDYDRGTIRVIKADDCYQATLEPDLSRNQSFGNLTPVQDDTVAGVIIKALDESSHLSIH